MIVTKRINLIFQFFLVVVALSFVSCSDKKSYWDEDESRFYIPSESLFVEVPKDEGWIVANPGSLPENLLFCTVRAESEIGIYLCVDTCERVNNAQNFSKGEIKRFISTIIRQSPACNDVCYGPIETDDCIYMTQRAIKFSSTMSIGEISVRFEGYVFLHKGKMLAFMATRPNLRDEETEEIVDGMLHSLRRL